MIKQCLNCNKKFITYKSTDQKFCNRSCYIDYKRKQHKNQITVTCEFCGKIFVTQNNCVYKASKNHFCSSTCANLFQKRNKIKSYCKVCGVELYSSKSRPQKYCSITCRNKDPEWAEKSYIKANWIQCNKKDLNNLEKAGNIILDELNLNYETQYLINNKICVDIYIKQYNLIIQWDGDYWHGHNIDESLLNEAQKKRKQLDYSQDLYFKACGFNELRFWETDVMNNKEQVKNTIIQSINKINGRTK